MKALRMPDPRREGKGVGACVAVVLCGLCGTLPVQQCTPHSLVLGSEPLRAPPCGLCSVQHPSVHTVHSIARTVHGVGA